MAEAAEQGHLAMSRDSWMGDCSSSALVQATHPFAGNASEAVMPPAGAMSLAGGLIEAGSIPLPGYTPRLRRPVAESQEIQVDPASVGGESMTGLPARQGPAEAASPSDGSVSLPGHQAYASPGQVLGNVALESRPNSASAPMQQPQKLPSPDRGPWWKRRFLSSGPGDPAHPPVPLPSFMFVTCPSGSCFIRIEVDIIEVDIAWLQSELICWWQCPLSFPLTSSLQPNENNKALSGCQ